MSSDQANKKSGQRLAFVFPGKGGLWKQMGQALYKENRIFKASVDECDAWMTRFGSPVSAANTFSRDISDELILSDEWMIPCLMIYSISVVRILESYSVRPDLVIGQSIGETTAALCSKALSLADAIQIALEISSWPDPAPEGAMVVANLTPVEAERLLTGYPDVSLAGISSPNSVFLSGSSDRLTEIVQLLTEKDIFVRKMQVGHAYHHAPFIQAKKSGFLSRLNGVSSSIPEVPFYSSFKKGNVLQEEMRADFWYSMMESRVFFQQAVEAALADEEDILFLEINPHPVLSFAIEDIIKTGRFEKAVVMHTLRKDMPDTRALAAVADILKNRPVKGRSAGDEGVAKQDGVETVADFLTREIAGLLGRPAESIEPHISLHDQGIDSLCLLQLRTKIYDRYGITIPVSAFWNYPEVDRLSKQIKEQIRKDMPERSGHASMIPPMTTGDDEVAIIGVACRLPQGIQTSEQLWEALLQGRDLVTNVPPDRWPADRFLDADPEAPGKSYTMAGSFLDDIFSFDNHFFNISAVEAAGMDPQQRILLETSWEAFENAGIPPSSLAGSRTGTFVGIVNSDYSQFRLTNGVHADLGPYDLTGNFFSITSGRLAYYYDLKGPAVSVDTACSSSLVTLDMACKGLKAGETDLAIVGGVNLIMSPTNYIVYSRMRALSPTGRCKAFDEDADGFVRGEGCIVLVLKRMKEARRDHNRIMAVIKATAVNSDGRSNGITAPNGASQEQMLRQALALGRIQAQDVSFIEAHGTGTKLGDPIEMDAIQKVFVPGRTDKLYVGSVKSNLGHLEPVSGLAGLLKLVMSIRHKVIPGNLHFNKLNSFIKKEEVIEIAGAAVGWEKIRRPFIGGVSSFGFSGTNAHVLIQEPEEDPGRPEQPNGLHILPLSARTPEALADLMNAYAGFLEANTHSTTADICYSAATARDHFPNRYACIFTDLNIVRQELRSNSRKILTVKKTGLPPDVSFLFTGQGSQYMAMGKSLYASFPGFRRVVDQCDAILKQYLDIHIPDVFLDKDSRIHQTLYVQPCLFVLQYGLVTLWQQWGIRPAVVLGHSIGEVAAAATAGVMSLEDAIKLIAHRALLMNTLPGDGGAMLAMLAPSSTVHHLIEPFEENEVGIAAFNGATNTVISGTAPVIRKIRDIARDRKINAFPLQTSHAFHSPLMRPILDDFRKAISDVKFSPPSIRYISTVTGDYADKEVTHAEYWCDQIVKPVRYMEAINRLMEGKPSVKIEIGPRPVLINMQLQGKPDSQWLPSMEEDKPVKEVLFGSLAALYNWGINIAWENVYPAETHRIADIPHYPFQKKTFRIEPIISKEMPIVETARPALPERDIRAYLGAALCELLHEDRIDTHTNLLEYGVDSVILITFLKEIENKYKIKIDIGELYGRLSSIEALSAHVAGLVKQEPAVPAPSGPLMSGDVSDIGALIRSQLSLMDRQLQLWQQYAPGPMEQGKSNAIQPDRSDPLSEKNIYNNLVSFRPIRTVPDEFTDRQKKFVATLVERYNERTKGSKAYAQQYRQRLADWIASIDFRLSIKELQYPIVSASAKGASLTDVDGNEYVDLAIGYGVNYFGNNAPFVRDAVRKQLEEGFEIAAQSDLAGETASLLAQVTGCERVAFCNTGTEAVMVAIRIARGATGRKKIVLFSGSYHGGFDGVLAQSNIVDGRSQVTPTSLGTTMGMVQDVIVLSYGTPESLDIIRKFADSLAAVLVEPVQSRRPGFHPGQFLKDLRQITTDRGICLIFDEIITGFRIGPGGAQEHFAVRADIATYGKIAGGGLPIGIVAGKREMMDFVDGGWWKFDDLSYPASQMVFFAGTFCKHPLSMAAANAVIKRIIREGPSLQNGVNRLTADMASAINSTFDRIGVPLQLTHFGSLFGFTSAGAYSKFFNPIEMNLLFYLLIERGIFTWERRICFLSTEHTAKDVQKVVDAIGDAVEELCRNDFFRHREQK